MSIFQILNMKVMSANGEKIGKVRDRLEHLRANAVKDRFIAGSGSKFTGLTLNTKSAINASSNVVASCIIIQSIWRGSNSRQKSVILAQGLDACARIMQIAFRNHRFMVLRAERAAILTLQSVWRARAAKNTAAMLIKEQKKSTAELAIKGRGARKRKLVASSSEESRKRTKNNARARDRYAKRKRTGEQNARAAKRFRDFIEYVRFSTGDTVIEGFESEVLNGGVIDDVRSPNELASDHADTYEPDSE